MVEAFNLLVLLVLCGWLIRCTFRTCAEVEAIWRDALNRMK